MLLVGRGIVVDTADVLKLLNHLDLITVFIGILIGLINEIGNLCSVNRFLTPLLIDNGAEEGEEEEECDHQNTHDRKLGSEESTHNEPYGAHLLIGFLLLDCNGNGSFVILC